MVVSQLVGPTEMLVVVLLVAALVAPSCGGKLPYMIGGSNVETPGTWPWQGSLQVTGLSHFCGCVVLSKTWMLTASSCFLLPSSMVIVLLGAHDVRTRLKGDPRYFTIDKVFKHPEFSTDDWQTGYPNDIGLVRLRDPVDLDNPYIAPIDLPAADAGLFLDSTCYMTGWGFTLRADHVMYLTGQDLGHAITACPSIFPPNVLKEAQTTVLTNAQCDAAWKAAIGPGLIHAGHMCVGGTGKEGACSGDSGGPVVCKSDDRWLLVGIISWGMNTCDAIYPTVCTRLTSYRKWISDTTEGEI